MTEVVIFMRINDKLKMTKYVLGDNRQSRLPTCITFCPTLLDGDLCCLPR